MNNIDFFNKVRILSGRGCFRSYRGLAGFGSRCLIVCGASGARLCGALSDAEALLAESGIAFRVFDRIEPNPLISTAEAGGRLAREHGADFILGIGGGSALDAAKAVAVFAANPQLSGRAVYTAARVPALPVLAVNTTAGTGSEVTPYSILTDTEAENKRSFSGDDIYPRVAFLDPLYTLSLPLSQTMATAADALCHAVEGCFMKKANALSDALAEKCIPMLASGLRAAGALPASELPDFAVREQLLYGSTLAGLVISRTGTGFVHSTGYMLTYNHGLPHGNANAYFLADFVAFMQKAEPERAEKVLSLIGVPDAEGIFSLLFASPAMRPDLKLPRELLVQYAHRTIGVKNVANAVSVITEAELCAILERRLGE